MGNRPSPYGGQVAGLAKNVQQPTFHTPPNMAGKKVAAEKPKERWSQQRADVAKANLMNMGGGVANKARPLAMMRHIPLTTPSSSMASFLERKTYAEKQEKEKAEANAKRKVAKNEPVPNAVWVKNLRWQVTWTEIKDHMGSVGKVEFATIVKNQWGQSNGSACVRFSTEEDAKRAIEVFHGSDFQDRPMHVEPWTGPIPATSKLLDSFLDLWYGPPKLTDKSIQGNPDQMVYVSGIKTSVKYEMLKAHLAKVGAVEKFHMVNKRGQQVAQVLYSNADEATKAITELNGSLLEEQAITVDKWVTNWRPEGGDSAKGEG